MQNLLLFTAPELVMNIENPPPHNKLCVNPYRFLRSRYINNRCLEYRLGA